MPIPEDKKKALIEKMGFPAALLDQVEQMNGETRKEAADAGLEKKETDAAVGTDTATETTPAEAPATETPAAEAETTAEQTPIVGATAQDIISAVAEVLEPIAKQVTTLTEVTKAQNDIIVELTKELDKIKTSDEQKVKETIAQTPMAALTAMLSNRVVGNASAEVGKEDSLVKSGPKETPPSQSAPLTVVPFLNSLMGDGK